MAVDNASLRKQEAVSRTKVYDVDASGKWPLVYHGGYDISFFGVEKCHPFDAGKWGRIIGFLVDDGVVDRSNVVAPRECEESDLLVTHTPSYLSGLRWSARVAAIMEVPFVACFPNFLVQRYALKNFRLQTGGTILACKLALEHGWAINVGGGFHHCSADRGGGFCCYADITLGLEFLLTRGDIKRALIVDLDAHQGNGHERDACHMDSVTVMDMYNCQIYPHDTHARKGIDVEVRLRVGTSDEEYLALLSENLTKALAKAEPDLLLFNAGTDCLEGDPLGAMAISPEGIVQRDEVVFRAAVDRALPIVMVTSGGYQRNNARIVANSIKNLLKKGIITPPKNGIA